MSGLLLVCFLLLSRQAAQVSGTMKEQENRKEIIAVDPGHGGADPGMVGLNGLEEKEINLKIACKLERVLTDKGYQVVMTRKKDQGFMMLLRQIKNLRICRGGSPFWKMLLLC